MPAWVVLPKPPPPAVIRELPSFEHPSGVWVPAYPDPAPTIIVPDGMFPEEDVEHEHEEPGRPE